MIELKNVVYKYKNGKNVINNLSYKFNQGECIAIVGRNGSGKSTLARLLAGITVPTSGEVMAYDINTKDKSKYIELRKNIGIVFQNPDNQVIFDNVYDEIAFTINNLKLEDEKKRIENAIEKVGMKEFMNANPYELSLGEKQKIAIASVLALSTNTIILDEPTTMLDNKSKNDIYNLIRELKTMGITVIFITNFIDEILIADKVVIMENGNITKEFAKKDIFNNIEELKNMEIGIPLLIKLLIKLKEKDTYINLEDYTEDEIINKVIEVLK